MGQSGEAASEPTSAGGRLPWGRSYEGREAWLGCQVPSPFVRLLSCCLGQSPEQPPPERADLSSQPAPAPIPARPLPSPARLQTQVRAGARERHPALATGGALGSWALLPSGREVPAERDLGLGKRAGRGQGRCLWIAPPPGPAELSRRRVPDSGPASCGGDFHLLGLLPSAHSVVRNLLFGKLAAVGLFGATLTPPHASSSLSLPLYSPRPGWGPIVCSRFAQLWGLSAHFPSDAGPTCQAALPSEAGWDGSGIGAGPGSPAQPVSGTRVKNWGLGAGVVHAWRIHPPSYRS
ncbi:unnamed protein product [Rangifer tarandus platyrhynchus]|uniref:Uncharacterized protein n=1 Tax=Rangifer tarandus platyrhynchus TaxID=3082113 RepID=A0AC59YZN4_RANTA